MCARVLDDEQPRDMPLHGRGDERGSGLCGGLRASGDVGRLAEDFAGRVDHHGPKSRPMRAVSFGRPQCAEHMEHQDALRRRRVDSLGKAGSFQTPKRAARPLTAL